MPNLFHERKKILERLRDSRAGKAPAAQPQYVRCPDCCADHTRDALRRSLYVCPRCGFHMAMPVRERLTSMFDGGRFREHFSSQAIRDPLGFPGYTEKINGLRRKTGLAEACISATGRIGGRRAVVAAQETEFMMGSMGTAVGEIVAQSAELARTSGLPLVIVCAGGGARMQEGIFSLMQMAKTSAAVRRFSDSGGLYIAVITNPTTGGITASYASLGDITLAEPGALFGFAGPRVIEQTIGETLPEGFQRSEFQLEHGFVDAVVPRPDMRDTVARVIKLHERRR